MRHIQSLFCFSLLCLGACGGGGTVDPELIPGGGAGSGDIDGEVNVFVIHAQSDAPVAGAKVLLGKDGPSAVTNEMGLAILSDSKLDGPQTITVTADGYVTTTWVGVNGANVTVPIKPTTVSGVDKAHATGSILGWDDLEPKGDYLLAAVLYSRTKDLDAPENNIETKNSANGGAFCIKAKSTLIPRVPCAWQLDTRVGKQVHYALLMDGKANGTPTDFDDDDVTVIGFAIGSQVELAKDGALGNEKLALVDSTDLLDVTLAFPTAPTGLEDLLGIALFDLGEAGRLVMLPFTKNTPTQKLPQAKGSLSTGHYEFIARAAAKDKEVPASATFMHNVGLTSAILTDDWLATPTNLAVNGTTYSFQGVSKANLYVADFRKPGDDDESWEVVLLDASSSFSLPTLSSDPLPTGKVEMRVSAVVFPGFAAGSFRLDNLTDKLASLATDTFTFDR